MKAFISLIFLALLILPACEQDYEHLTTQSDLRRMEESAAKGFLPTVATPFESRDGQLQRAAKRGTIINKLPAPDYLDRFRAQVAAMLKRHWSSIEASELKSAAEPGNLKNMKWHDENQKRLNAMFQAIGDAELTEKWRVLSAERKKVEQGILANMAEQDVRKVQGKVLAWTSGFHDRDLSECVLKKVKPIAPDKDWVVLDKAPSAPALKAAWGTVEMNFKMTYTEYEAAGGRIPGNVAARVPSALSLSVRAKIPGRGDLPPVWRTEGVAPNPRSISKGHDLSAKVAAAQLNLERVRFLLPQACKRFSMKK